MKVNLENGYRLIRDNLYNCRCISVKIENARFHHNSSYKKAPDIIKNGILSYEEQMKLQGRVLTLKEKLILEDEYHVNGLDKISLAAIDINDFYRDEMVYDPFNSGQIDFLISSHVKAYRNSTNYANEFLASNKINPELIKSIDIRIIKNYIDKSIIYQDNSELSRLKKIIEYYNCLKKIVISLREMNLDIPIREMSEEEITLDKNKILELPSIII